MGRLGRVTLAVLGFVFFLSSGIQAETVDYSTDKVLLETEVNTASLHGKPVKLADVFALVESQTKLKFFYVADRIPVEGTLTLEDSGTMSLAQLFSTLSSMANVVFHRQNQTIIVRRPISKNEQTSSAHPMSAPIFANLI